MNKFLKEFKDRGYFYQCTNEYELSDLLDKKSINALFNEIHILNERIIELQKNFENSKKTPFDFKVKSEIKRKRKTK